LKKIKFILLGLLFIGNLTYCQTTLFGVLKDTKNNPISNASIILKSTTSEAVIGYCYSDEVGHYELKIKKTGNFILVFSAYSYESVSEGIELTDGNNILENNKILVYKPIELNEVFINVERPITVKKDTITFLAKSFIQGNEKVVEDLLKKIPGLNITEDGTIRVGNQEVEKVMIEGDDFFEKGYKIVTKNMPVNPIEKVELYQNYSNNKHLKGIEKSDKVALNLKLKQDAKRQWFGNLEFGYGLASEDRYDLQSNLMNFGKKNKFYFITNLNNIGDDATGNIDHLIRPYNSEASESLGDNENAYSLIDLSSDVPNLKQKRVNFNNAEMLSLSTIFTLSSKTKLKTLGFFNSDENDFFRNSFQSFSIGNTNFENSEDFKGRKTKITGFGKVDLTHDISKNKTIEYSAKFNSTKEKDAGDVNFNGDLLNEKLRSNNELFDQKLVFTNKFKSNKVLLLSGRYIIEKTPQNYAVNQFIYQDLFNQDGDNVEQGSENRMQFAGFNARLLDRKKSGNLFELEIGNKFRRDNLITNFQLIESNNNITEPSGYQNQFLYTSNDLYLSSKYVLKIKKVNFIFQSDLHQLFNKIESYDNSKTQNPFFVNPKIAFEWNINKKNKVFTSYSYNTTNATALETYNSYVHTGFRYFAKGTGNFNQLDASSASLNYTYGSWGDKFFASTFIMYTKNHDFFSTNTLVSQNYSQSEVIMINGREFLTISSNIDRFFKPISTNLKFTFNATKSNYKNIVNDSELREVKNTLLNYGFELRSSFKGIFNYHIGSKWNYNEIKTTINNSFTDNTTFLDLSFVMNDKLNFQIQTERYYFGNLEKQNNKYYFMDIEARYTVKENKLSFSISGNNLFNTSTFKNYNISDISISKTEYRLQPRYVLLKTEFRF
jgi:hypothetical protein